MINDLITHLQGAGLTPRVEYAFTAEPVEDYNEDLPVILVFPVAATASPSSFDNQVIQDVEVSVACLLGCEIQHYEALLAEMRAALIGWVHDATVDALELDSGEITGIRGGYIWWQEIYTTMTQVRQA